MYIESVSLFLCNYLISLVFLPLNYYLDCGSGTRSSKRKSARLFCFVFLCTGYFCPCHLINCNVMFLYLILDKSASSKLIVQCASLR